MFGNRKNNYVRYPPVIKNRSFSTFLTERLA
nr:MAG TPA: hypothetical protein [Caudoviricetes sp.]